MSPFLVTSLLLAAPGPDVHVDGDGYMRLAYQGRVVYARSGQIVANQGKLGLPGGACFLPAISFSGDPGTISVDLDGTVRTSGNVIGRLVLAMFDSETPHPEGSYCVAASRPALVRPGDGLAGVISGPAVAAKTTPKVAAKAAQPQPEPASQPKLNLAPGTVLISIRPTTVVSSDTFTLGQIAGFAGDAKLSNLLSRVVVGDTPGVGVPRGLDLGRVLSRIRGAGIDETKVRIDLPSGATVRRQANEVSDEAFFAAVSQEIERRDGHYGQLSLDRNQGPMSIPPGDMKLVVEKLDSNLAGYRASVAVYVNSQLVNRRMLVVTRSGVPSQPRVGETVTARLISGGACIEVTAKVTRVGKPGDPIEIEAKGGGKMTGRLLKEGLIEVRL